MSEVILSPRIVYFSGKTRNTARFVAKLNLLAYRIPQDETEGLYLCHLPYVLITPTYSTGRGLNAVPQQIEDFLKHECHRFNLKGVIGAGNRNFGTTFGIAADILSQRHRVPILHKFELFGMPSDIAISTTRIQSCLTPSFQSPTIMC